MGLKPPGVRGSVRNVSVGTLAIPDDVEYQWAAEDFASPWPAAIGGANMSVTGLTASTFSNGETAVNGDGTNDHGTAPGPESYGGYQTFGIAFTVEFASVGADDMLTGSRDGNNSRIQIKDAGAGDGTMQIVVCDSNTNFLRTSTTSQLADGTPHAVVVNKSGDDASSINWYVDDMATAEQSVDENGAFDSANYSNARDMGFYARNNAGSIDFRFAADAGAFEFKSTPYSQSERESFVSRRPEV